MSSGGQGDGTAGSVWTSVGNFLFTAIRLNVVLILACAPLVALVVFATSPLRALPALVVAAYLSSPGLALAFAAFRDAPGFEVGPHSLQEEFSDSPAMRERYWQAGDSAVLRPAWAAYRSLAGRSLAVAALPMGIALVVAVDIAWAVSSSSPAGVYLVPALCVAAALCVAVWLVALTLAVELNGGGAWHIVRAAGACVVRRWYFSVFSLAVVAGLGAALYAQPAIVAVLLLSPILYLVWANCRWSAMPVLRATVARAAEDRPRSAGDRRPR